MKTNEEIKKETCNLCGGLGLRSTPRLDEIFERYNMDVKFLKSICMLPKCQKCDGSGFSDWVSNCINTDEDYEDYRESLIGNIWIMKSMFEFDMAFESHIENIEMEYYGGIRAREKVYDAIAPNDPIIDNSIGFFKDGMINDEDIVKINTDHFLNEVAPYTDDMWYFVDRSIKYRINTLLLSDLENRYSVKNKCFNKGSKEGFINYSRYLGFDPDHNIDYIFKLIEDFIFIGRDDYNDNLNDYFDGLPHTLDEVKEALLKSK